MPTRLGEEQDHLSESSCAQPPQTSSSISETLHQRQDAFLFDIPLPEAI